jgi:transposase-like protein
VSGYFNLEFNPQLARSLTHTLNRRYKGSRKFQLAAPDAPGTLIVWARSEDEARDHIQNAIFDLIFQRNRVGASVTNPACIFCGGRTQSHGRNSSGTQGWKCLNIECQRRFVIDRTFRGGINHPSQSKKPEFARLLLSGLTVREAADKVHLNVSTAGNWAEKIAALNPGKLDDLKCSCGKPLRHRGTCAFRLGYGQQSNHPKKAVA